MKARGGNFVMFKRRSDRFAIGHNVGFQNFTHFIPTWTGQKLKFGQNFNETHPLGAAFNAESENDIRLAVKIHFDAELGKWSNVLAVFRAKMNLQGKSDIIFGFSVKS